MNNIYFSFIGSARGVAVQETENIQLEGLIFELNYSNGCTSIYQSPHPKKVWVISSKEEEVPDWDNMTMTTRVITEVFLCNRASFDCNPAVSCATDYLDSVREMAN